MTHNIKILNSFAEAVFNGIKTFEVRENDRGYQKGDLIYFTVIEKDGIEITNHPLSKRCYEITYVLNGWGIKENYVVFGMKQIS